MAWFKTGGGALNETVLWTNPSPTSTFAAQEITFSDDVNNYKYIKVYFRLSTSNSAISSVMYDIETFLNLKTLSTLERFYGCMCSYVGSGNVARRLGYSSSGKFQFYNAANIGAASQSNTACIPTKVVGLK